MFRKIAQFGKYSAIRVSTNLFMEPTNIFIDGYVTTEPICSPTTVSNLSNCGSFDIVSELSLKLKNTVKIGYYLNVGNCYLL